MKKKGVDYFRVVTECFGKHRYENSALASEVAQRQRKSKDVTVTYYHCLVCGGYHIGNKRNKLIKVRKHGHEKLTGREHE